MVMIRVLDLEEIDVRPVDLEVLEAFPDGESNVAFQGLKRKLGMHQESLSRALRRLEDEELVIKTRDGYRLTSTGQSILKGAVRPTVAPRTVLETYLPSDISESTIIDRLKYSWFSSLRWLGYRVSKSQTVLTWVSDDGEAQIHAIFTGRSLRVDIESKNESKSGLALRFAHELMSRIIREYRKVAVANQATLPAIPTTA